MQYVLYLTTSTVLTARVEWTDLIAHFFPLLLLYYRTNGRPLLRSPTYFVIKGLKKYLNSYSTSLLF